ncbi:MAG: hypothetical protein ACI9S8_002144 [Chlamydiales bacterium]
MLVDKDFSSGVGAENLLTIHKAFQKGDKFLYTGPVFNRDDGWGFLARFAKLVFLDVPVADYTLLLQHEVFGHGARLRSIGLSPSYDLPLPVPYGEGGGATYFSGYSISPRDEMGIDTGGVESTEVLANKLGKKAISKGTLNFQEALLYFGGHHDQTFYILGDNGKGTYASGHDIRSYHSDLTQFLGRETVSYDKLRKYAYWNYADSMSLLSLYTIWQYMFDAEREQEIPMFSMGGVEFLPGYRLALTPYGIEHGLNSYLNFQESTGFAYIRFGDNDERNSYAFGFDMNKLWENDDFSYGIKADFWKQPVVGQSEGLHSKDKIGGALSIRSTYQFAEDYGIFAELGGKTKGYLLGESLDKDVKLTVGLALLSL